MAPSSLLTSEVGRVVRSLYVEHIGRMTLRLRLFARVAARLSVVFRDAE